MLVVVLKAEITGEQVEEGREKHQMGAFLCSCDLFGWQGGAVVQGGLRKYRRFNMNVFRWICSSGKACMKLARHKAEA